MKIFFFVLLLPVVLLSQSGYGKVSGRILDEQTKLPVESVNIFIANSLVGTSSNRNGYFEIDKIPPGRYNLIISHLSYENQSISADIKKNKIFQVDLELHPKPIEFPEIDISDLYDKEWQKNLEIFQESLFGSTWFAKGCEILNPFTISFNKDEKGILYAETNVPIEIENRSLGYIVNYYLEYFSYDYGTIKYSGHPYFEEMKSDFDEDHDVWKNNRLEAYMGSLRHFLRTLATAYNLIKEKKDSVTILVDLDNVTEGGTKFIYDDSMFMRKNGFDAYLNEYYLGAGGRRAISRIFYPDSIITESTIENELYLKTDKAIQITYNKEYNDLNYQPQISMIKLHSDSVYFDKRGRYHDEFKLQVFGYMARQRLSEMLPFEYEPSDSVLINTDFR